MAVARSVLLKETGRTKEELESTVVRLRGRGVTGLSFGRDERRMEDGSFKVVETYFSDRGAGILRRVFANEDHRAGLEECDCYSRETRFENGVHALPGTHDPACISQIPKGT